MILIHHDGVYVALDRDNTRFEFRPHSFPDTTFQLVGDSLVVGPLPGWVSPDLGRTWIRFHPGRADVVLGWLLPLALEWCSGSA